MKILNVFDFNGMAYKYVYGGAPMLTTNHNGTIVNTTVSNYTIKEIIRISHGQDLAVVRDIGQSDFRKKYMMDNLGSTYKEGRKKAPPILYTGIDLTFEILANAGIKTYGISGVEADDIIASIVHKYKDKYDEIRVYTGDKDLIQLVGNKVVVYYRHKKSYLEINEFNFESVITEIGKFKDLIMPFNIVGMYLWLVGDKEDNIPGLSGLGPKTFNKFISLLDNADIDFLSCNLNNSNYILNNVVKFLGTSEESVNSIKEYLSLTLPLVRLDNTCEVKEPSSYAWSDIAQKAGEYSIILRC